MTKMGFLIFSVAFIASTTMVVSYMPSLSSDNIFGDITDIPEQEPGFLESIIDAIGLGDTFIGEIAKFLTIIGDIILFRVEGLPVFMNIIFIVVSVGALYILFTGVRGN